MQYFYVLKVLSLPYTNTFTYNRELEKQCCSLHKYNMNKRAYQFLSIFAKLPIGNRWVLPKSLMNTLFTKLLKSIQGNQ